MVFGLFPAWPWGSSYLSNNSAGPTDALRAHWPTRKKKPKEIHIVAPAGVPVIIHSVQTPDRDTAQGAHYRTRQPTANLVSAPPKTHYPSSQGYVPPASNYHAPDGLPSVSQTTNGYAQGYYSAGPSASKPWWMAPQSLSTHPTPVAKPRRGLSAQSPWVFLSTPAHVPLHYPSGPSQRHNNHVRRARPQAPTAPDPPSGSGSSFFIPPPPASTPNRTDNVPTPNPRPKNTSTAQPRPILRQPRSDKPDVRRPKIHHNLMEIVWDLQMDYRTLGAAQFHPNRPELSAKATSDRFTKIHLRPTASSGHFLHLWQCHAEHPLQVWLILEDMMRSLEGWHHVSISNRNKDTTVRDVLKELYKWMREPLSYQEIQYIYQNGIQHVARDASAARCGAGTTGPVKEGDWKRIDLFGKNTRFKGFTVDEVKSQGSTLVLNFALGRADLDW